MSKFRELSAYVYGLMMAPPEARNDATAEGSEFAKGYYQALGDVLLHVRNMEHRDQKGTP